MRRPAHPFERDPAHVLFTVSGNATDRKTVALLKLSASTLTLPHRKF